MKIKFRVKVKANSSTELTKLGLGVNLYNCAEGEYYIVGPNEGYLNEAIKAHSLVTISEIEAI